MFPKFLLPETTLRESGAGSIITLDRKINGVSLLTLGITRISEREGVEFSVWGSPDQINWGSEPLAIFTEKFYCGDYQTELDLSARPDVKYLRAQWRVEPFKGAKVRSLCTAYLQLNSAERRLAACGA